MPRPVLVVLVALVYALHQDFWFWDTAHPVILDLLPVGLAYHAAYSVLVAGVMWLVVRSAWPDLPTPSGAEGNKLERSETEARR